MKKERKGKISLTYTTSNTLVAPFGREGDTKSSSTFANNHPRERSRDESEAETRKEVGPGDDEAERGSVLGRTRWRRNDRGKLSATTTKRPSPKSAATTTKRPSSKPTATTTKRPSPNSAATTNKRPSSKSAATATKRPSPKSAAGHRGHPGRRPEAGGRHSCELENIASSAAGHNGNNHRKN